jgi:hypothetical protein
MKTGKKKTKKKKQNIFAKKKHFSLNILVVLDAQGIPYSSLVTARVQSWDRLTIELILRTLHHNVNKYNKK